MRRQSRVRKQKTFAVSKKFSQNYFPNYLLWAKKLTTLSSWIFAVRKFFHNIILLNICCQQKVSQYYPPEYLLWVKIFTKLFSWIFAASKKIHNIILLNICCEISQNFPPEYLPWATIYFIYLTWKLIHKQWDEFVIELSICCSRLYQLCSFWLSCTPLVFFLQGRHCKVFGPYLGFIDTRYLGFNTRYKFGHPIQSQRSDFSSLQGTARHVGQEGVCRGSRAGTDLNVI